MILGKVVAQVVSTVKHEAYQSRTVLVVRPVSPDGAPRKGAIVAVDTVGAREDDMVLVASEGRAAMEILGYSHRIPIRSVIVGIVDRITRSNEEQAS
jgi:microcompartment protein CcmK/EutM